ncbi:hypothetical protein BU15DRAFT_39120 [Melanogaster broomeanus]|nr:hypothetical protein BU15DRAFT_39120 [Melanogaster broomeanus]
MNKAASRAILKLLPTPLPPSLRTTPANIFQVLSRYPDSGVGQKIHQIRWSEKGIDGCYWEVTRTKLKLAGSHGKVWGRLVWRGKLVSEREERIPGTLKYKWSTGRS